MCILATQQIIVVMYLDDLFFGLDSVNKFGNNLHNVGLVYLCFKFAHVQKNFLFKFQGLHFFVDTLIAKFK
jgi:hypothetical protein